MSSEIQEIQHLPNFDLKAFHAQLSERLSKAPREFDPTNQRQIIYEVDKNSVPIGIRLTSDDIKWIVNIILENPNYRQNILSLIDRNVYYTCRNLRAIPYLAQKMAQVAMEDIIFEMARRLDNKVAETVQTTGAQINAVL